MSCTDNASNGSKQPAKMRLSRTSSLNVEWRKQTGPFFCGEPKMTTDPKKNDDIKDEELDKVSGGTGDSTDEGLAGGGGGGGGGDDGSGGGGSTPAVKRVKAERE